MAEEIFDEQDIDNVPDADNVTENLNISEEVQEAESDSSVAVEKKWPGWPGENVFRMLVPVQRVGGIIGRKGEFIKKICEETKARIKILDGPPGTIERTKPVRRRLLSVQPLGTDEQSMSSSAPGITESSSDLHIF